MVLQADSNPGANPEIWGGMMAFGDRLRKNKWGRAALGVATGGLSEAALGIQSAATGAKDPSGRAFAGIFTGGLSEAAGAAARKVKENKAAREGAWSDLMNDKPPSLTMPVDRTKGYYDQAVSTAKQPTARSTFAGAKDASGYLTGIDKALGIQTPEDTRKVVKKAAMTQLNQGAHAQDVAEAARLQQMGAVGSPLELALQGRRANDLAGQKAQAVAGIEQDYANRVSEYDAARRNAALQSGRDMTQVSQYNAGQQNANNQYLSGLYGDIGQRVGTQDLARATLDYEANQLFPFQVSQANKMAYANKLEQDRANRINWLFGGIDAATKIGSAVAGAA